MLSHNDAKSDSAPDAAADSALDAHLKQLLNPEVDEELLAEQYDEAAPYGDGRFLVGESIGIGAMGRVFCALDTQTSQEVAIKVMNGHLRSEAPLCEKFREEADLLKRFAHPHVVQFIAFGEDPGSGDLYFAMELMQGSLRTAVGRPLPAAKVITWLRSACLAIQHAHSMGIAHRDLRASNFLLTKDGLLKVGDFGVASSTVEHGMHEVKAAMRQDIRDLGHLFYLLLTGMSAHKGSPDIAKLTGLPKLADAICIRAMSENPSKQFAAAAEMEATLAKLAEQLKNPPPVWFRPLLYAAALAAISAIAWTAVQKFNQSRRQEGFTGPTSANSEPVVRTDGLAVLASLPPASSPAEATKDRPFVIPGGHHFLPVPKISHVLLDATEVHRTQVEEFLKHFDRKAKATSHFLAIMDYDGESSSRSTKYWDSTCPNPTDAAGGLSVWDAQAYCKWLTQREQAAGRIPANAFFRLPWLKEWFYALGVEDVEVEREAKLATGRFPWGAEIQPSGHAGNYGGLELRDDPSYPKQWSVLPRRDDYIRVAPTGSYAANDHGFYNLMDNLTEWMHDTAYHTKQAASAHLEAGGSWRTGGEGALRWINTGYDYDSTGAVGRGFRVALQLAPPDTPWLQMSLQGVTDLANNAKKAFTTKETARVTWKIHNYGTPVEVIVKTNLSTRPHLEAPVQSASATLYRSPSKEKTAIGGGITKAVSVGRDETVYIHFDIQTNMCSAGTHAFISGQLSESSPEERPLESTGPGAAMPMIHGWSVPAFVLKE